MSDNIDLNAPTVGHANVSHPPHDPTEGSVVAPPAESSAQQDEEWPASAESYELVGKIGQGAFASVWRARCVANGAPCAIKVLDLEHVDTNFVDIRLEVQTMRLSSHPNVLRCYTSFVQKTDLWLVTQLMIKGSSLHCLQSARIKIRGGPGEDGLMSGFSGGDVPPQSLLFEDHVTYILYETLLGMKYIHDNGAIHRDIKAGNILLDGNGDVRIADFGVSGWLVHGGAQRENTKTFVGTPCWMAPEVMEQVSGYDYKADIWSLGITALELAKGYAPYAKFPPMKVLLLTIQEDPPSLETYQDDDDINMWSKSFRSMIKLCLQKDPTKRPSCMELLAHKHFKPLSDDDHRSHRRERIKTELCQLVDDVGGPGAGGSSDRRQLPGTAPVCVVSSTEENRPAGTTWIFSDGSQVLASSTSNGEGAGADDKDAFFDEFERQTGGENFVPQIDPSLAASAGAAVVEAREEGKQTDKEDMNDFFDEFEKTTGGENFRKPA